MYYSAFQIPETNDLGTASSSEFLQINCLGYYEFENTGYQRYRKHGRNDYLLIYNLEGKAIARSQGIDYEVGNGAVIIYRPGEEHFYKLSEDFPIKSIWIHFTGYGVESILEKLKMADCNIYQIGQTDEIPILTRMMRNEIQAQRIGSELYTASLFIQILSLISRRYLHFGFSGKLLESTHKLDFSISYLQANYQKNITVPELSDLAGLCISRYIHLFKMRMGSTPKDYLISFRLQRAKELMRDTSLTIRQISLTVGFADPLYFSKVFKKHEGISPSLARIESP